MKLYALDGKSFDTVKVGHDADGCLNAEGACCCCQQPKGSDHSPGCDWEPCPRCGGQFIACECECDVRPAYDAEEAQGIIMALTVALRMAM